MSGATLQEGIQGSTGLPRALIFTGTVDCLPCGDGRWRLRGRLRSGAADDAQDTVELLLTGVRLQPGVSCLPSRLHELCIRAGDGTPQTLQLAAREGCFDLEVDRAALHRDVGALFFRAVPGIPPARSTRLGWAVLLTLLRLPLVARLASRAGE